jgi:hypothetical protein
MSSLAPWLLALALLGCSKGSTTSGDAGARDVQPAVMAGRADAGAPCSRDTDCRLVDDYCEGCDCRALSRHDPDPTCSGPGVRCFRQPCADLVAACEQGRCVARRR